MSETGWLCLLEGPNGRPILGEAEVEFSRVYRNSVYRLQPNEEVRPDFPYWYLHTRIMTALHRLLPGGMQGDLLVRATGSGRIMWDRPEPVHGARYTWICEHLALHNAVPLTTDDLLGVADLTVRWCEENITAESVASGKWDEIAKQLDRVRIGADSMRGDSRSVSSMGVMLERCVLRPSWDLTTLASRYGTQVVECKGVQVTLPSYRWHSRELRHSLSEAQESFILDRVRQKSISGAQKVG